MIRERDNGARALLRKIKKRPTVKIGVLGDGSDPKIVRTQSGTTTSEDTVADVASQHEFGIGVPRRSFIADWADESEIDAKKRLSKMVKRILKEDRPLETELERFGLWAQGEIRQRIRRGIPPPLADITVERKGSSTPLIDTGQLWSSITYEVDLG